MGGRGSSSTSSAASGGGSTGLVSGDDATSKMPMNSSQEASLKYYQQQGYYDINSQLRTSNGKLSQQAEEHKKNIDSMMQKTKGEIEVYRGYNEMSRTAAKFKDLKPGDKLQDKGYTSTSMSKKIAKQFADEGTEWKEVVRVSKGTNVINMNKQIYNKSFGKEKEIIIHRNNIRTITKVDTKTKTIYTRV